MEQQSILESNITRTIETYHSQFTSHFELNLRKELEKSVQSKVFKSYIKEKQQELKDEEETIKWISAQSAHLLISRLLFHKLLSKFYDTLPQLPNLKETGINGYVKSLKQIFVQICEKIGFEIIFQKSNNFEIIPESNDFINVLHKFVEKIRDLDISLLNKDIIGRVYEKTIPRINKHMKGQYYTPENIADLIAELAIHSANDKILDCSCGSGIFLMSAYKKLSEFSKNYHTKIINQLTGVDINYFPVHLTAFNLIIKDISNKPKALKIFPLDFFEISPRDGILNSEFDVIITNPPYTEAREIGNDDYKEKIRKIALDYQDQLSKTIGIYGYFYTHANHFLKEHGYIGFIVNNSFMETKGGWSLCKYFLDNFKLKYLIKFAEDVFEDADVKSVITILEKCSDKSERDKNVVKFVKIYEQFNPKKITNEIQRINTNHSNRQFGLLTVNQSSLYNEKNWMFFFKQYNEVDLFTRIFTKNDLAKLEDYCEIRSCFKDGGYEFFFIKKEDNEELQIEPQYLENIIHSPRNFTKLNLKNEDVEESVLIIKSLNNLLKSRTRARNYIKEWMGKKIKLKKGKDKGKTITGIQNMPTFKNRPDWYNVTHGAIKGDLLFQGYIDQEMKCFINECNAYSAANFVTLKVRNPEYVPIIALVLNSSLLQFYYELKGKIMGANALAIANYILKATKIPKLENLSKEILKKASVILNLLKNAKFGSDDFNSAKNLLNALVFDIFNVSYEDQIQINKILPKIISSRLKK
ncbi:MAG: HsdM family class I SAM-dependent methyltransferase [Candidatus Helarchaeota archaeon]